MEIVDKMGLCKLKTSSFYHRYGNNEYDRIGGDNFSTTTIRPYTTYDDVYYCVWMPEYTDTVVITSSEFKEQFSFLDGEICDEES